MANPKFVALDAGAKDGLFHLLRDMDGNQHCAHWDGTEFVYKGGERVAGVLTAYASRQWA